MFFRSAKALTEFAEPIDVQDETSEVYDSDGVALRLSTDGRTIILSYPEEPLDRSADLRRLIATSSAYRQRSCPR